MPMNIILRTDANINLFQDVIINTISLPIGDSILLCSGFFQEGRGQYFVSRENQFTCRLAQSGKTITTIGVHNNMWRNEYIRFIERLRNANIQVDARLHRGFKWHAKIYLLVSDGSPIMGIIGSSNMTRNAFGRSIPFNIESDVVLWEEEYAVIDGAMEKIFNKVNPSMFYRVRYLPEDNADLSIADRLRSLYNIINEQSYIEL